MAFETVKKNLESRGFSVQTFATAAEAAEYLNRAIDGVSVGIGGSITVQQMGLHDRLASHNTVYWHWTDGPEVLSKAMTAQVYLTSVNGLAETERSSTSTATATGWLPCSMDIRRSILVAGRNKLAPTYEEALWRARNIAAPKNAQRLGKKTPCAVKGDRCYDCKSPERICRGLAVLWEAMSGVEMEVVLVDEDLGY